MSWLDTDAHGHAHAHGHVVLLLLSGYVFWVARFAGDIQHAARQRAAVVAVYALLPRWVAPMSWLLLGASVLFGPMFGPDLGLPQWALGISPFTHQKAPALEIGIAAIIALLAISVALVSAGLAAFRRRDLVVG